MWSQTSTASPQWSASETWTRVSSMVELTNHTLNSTFTKTPYTGFSHRRSQMFHLPSLLIVNAVYIPEDVDPNSPIEPFKLFLMPKLLTTSAMLVMNMPNLRKRNAQRCTVTTKWWRNDFYELLGGMIYLVYRRILRYHLAWSPSLCCDPFLVRWWAVTVFKVWCPSC